MNDILPIKSASNAPSYLHVIPFVEFYIKSFTTNNNKTELLGDTKKLYNYYKGFTKNLNQNIDSNLESAVNQVVADKKSDLEKVKAILYWVKKNIKYIAFENGYEGFVPREANLVFERKFGDCKDMASIITAMAKVAKIKNVSIAWIGTRKIPYSYDDLPTPSVDNHMIAVYTADDNRTYFLDATDKETRFGLPTSFIQGKDALVGQAEDYKIVQVPITQATENNIIDEINIKIEDEKVVGNGKTQYFGYNRSHLLMRIGDETGLNRFESIKDLVIKGNNKYKLKSFTEDNIENIDLPYAINYNFEIENYLVKVDNEIYINLSLDKSIERLALEKDRKLPFEFEYLANSINAYKLEIPANSKIKFVPNNFNISNDLISANIKYETKNNNIELKITLQQNKLLLYENDFELWNESIKKIRTALNESIILTLK